MSNIPFNHADVGDRARAIEASIANKQARRPRVDNQGRPLAPVVMYEYDNQGRLIGPAKVPAPTPSSTPAPTTPGTVAAAADPDQGAQPVSPPGPEPTFAQKTEAMGMAGRDGLSYPTALGLVLNRPTPPTAA